MTTFRSKIAFTGALLAESSLVFAHSGDHGVSPWHHFLTSADHTAALVLIALVVSVSGIRALCRSVSARRAALKNTDCSRYFHEQRGNNARRSGS